MHGLVNRSLQNFLADTYGTAIWTRIATQAAVPGQEFESLMLYDDDLTDTVIGAASDVLRKPRAMLLEDWGTYLVTHPNSENLRRLLRFAGVTFEDFLHSLDDLPDRARLAVSDLDLPPIELEEVAATRFTVHCGEPVAGLAHVAVGVLRAMADDYGALVVLDTPTPRGEIGITMVEPTFAEGRRFDLGAGQA